MTELNMGTRSMTIEYDPSLNGVVMRTSDGQSILFHRGFGPSIIAAIRKECGNTDHTAPPDSAEMRLREVIQQSQINAEHVLQLICQSEALEKRTNELQARLNDVDEHQSDLLERINIANRKLTAMTDALR